MLSGSVARRAVGFGLGAEAVRAFDGFDGFDGLLRAGMRYLRILGGDRRFRAAASPQIKPFSGS
jgi:hypothetical protein